MDILKKIECFYKEFRGEKQVLGKSYLGKNIYCFKVSFTDKPTVICQYAMHAREHITALLCLKHVEYYARKNKVGTVYFIPTINPDGIQIAQTKNPLYKANFRGVDLNVNFDARWAKGVTNVFTAGQENYVGECPFSEVESKILRDFTLKVMPDATISYHSKGEEIYYEFFQDKNRLKRDFAFAKTISKCCGYNIKSTPNSCGGYKDWCVQKLKIPALTIEVGSDKLKHPISHWHLRKINKKTKNVLNQAIEFLLEN